MTNVGHRVLVPGILVKSPSGSKDWVVVGNNNDEIKLACVSKYMVKSTKELAGWEIIENEKKEN